MSDRRPNSSFALPESDRCDSGSAAGIPDCCPSVRDDGERQARLIRAIESQIVPRLLIALGCAHRRIARVGDAAPLERSAEDLANFTSLAAAAETEIDPLLGPTSL